jgi:hypothetical protein
MRIASDEGDGILLRDGLKVSTGLSPRGITQTGPGDIQGFKVRVRDVQLVARVASPITHHPLPFASVISAVNSLSAVARKLQNVTSKGFSG